jgi:hypothetical protein
MVEGSQSRATTCQRVSFTHSQNASRSSPPACFVIRRSVPFGSDRASAPSLSVFRRYRGSDIWRSDNCPFYGRTRIRVDRALSKVRTGEITSDHSCLPVGFEPRRIGNRCVVIHSLDGSGSLVKSIVEVVKRSLPSGSLTCDVGLLVRRDPPAVARTPSVIRSGRWVFILLPGVVRNENHRAAELRCRPNSPASSAFTFDPADIVALFGAEQWYSR